jgi:Ca2+-binding RTX toxin-like protein
VESGDVNFTLWNTRLVGQGVDTLVGINGARLTGGAGNNVFNLSRWTLAASLDGGAGLDTVVSSINANAALTDARLTRAGTAAVNLTSIESARLTGGAGHDVLNAAGFSGGVTLSGAGGNDVLRAGLGASILQGGAGNDRLVGNAARDLLFGGVGLDFLAGGGDDDLLVHGATRYDANAAALAALQAEWLRGDLAYAARVNNLRNGGGLNGGVRLAGAVADDRSRDSLRGDLGLDWFWAKLPPGVADALLAREPGEAVN